MSTFLNTNSNCQILTLGLHDEHILVVHKPEEGALDGKKIYYHSVEHSVSVIVDHNFVRHMQAVEYGDVIQITGECSQMSTNSNPTWKKFISFIFNEGNAFNIRKKEIKEKVDDALSKGVSLVHISHYNNIVAPADYGTTTNQIIQIGLIFNSVQTTTRNNKNAVISTIAPKKELNRRGYKLIGAALFLIAAAIALAVIFAKK